MSKRHLNIKVSGRVQGVYFRYSAMGKATELKVKGFVRNEEDGSVYIEAEGEDKNLNEFVAWCQKGPDRAIVSEIFVKEGEVMNFVIFEIER